MIERLPEPTRTPAMRPSWLERDQTALAPLFEEQSCLRPFSARAVRGGESPIGDSVLRVGGRSGKSGERCAMITVHRDVHRLVHPNLTANFPKLKEMHSDESRDSHTVWLGVGLERPRFSLPRNAWRSLQPNIAGCAMRTSKSNVNEVQATTPRVTALAGQARCWPLSVQPQLILPSPYYFTSVTSRCTSPCIGRQILTCDRNGDFQSGNQHASQIGQEAGATPPLVRTVRPGVVGSLPPRIAGLRDEFCAACNGEF